MYAGGSLRGCLREGEQGANRPLTNGKERPPDDQKAVENVMAVPVSRPSLRVRLRQSGGAGATDLKPPRNYPRTHTLEYPLAG